MYLWGSEGMRSLSGRCFHLDCSGVLDQKRWRSLQSGVSESW